MNKSLINNAIFNLIYKFLNTAFPMIVAIYSSRILSVENIGEVSFAQNIVQYFVYFAILGIPNYAIREIAKKKKIRMN